MLERGLDELAGEARGVAGVAREDVGELLVVDLLREPVGADEEHLAAGRGDEPHVGVDDLVGADRARDHVAVGVALGLVGADEPRVDELLHGGVVDAELLERAAVPRVDAGVADVEDHPVESGTVARVDEGDAR